MIRVRALRALVPVAVVSILMIFGGTAVAYWSGGGTGSGSSSAGAIVPVTLSGATPSAPLYPGALGNVTLTISNPNLAVVRIGTLMLDTSQGSAGFAVDAGHSGCATSTLGFTTQTNGGSGWVVPARAGAVDGTLSVTLTNAISMGSSAANACQGATFTVYLIAGA